MGFSKLAIFRGPHGYFSKPVVFIVDLIFSTTTKLFQQRMPLFNQLNFTVSVTRGISYVCAEPKLQKFCILFSGYILKSTALS